MADEIYSGQSDWATGEFYNNLRGRLLTWTDRQTEIQDSQVKVLRTKY